MPTQTQLHLTPELTQILMKIQENSTPQETAIIFTDIANILDSLVHRSYDFQCGLAEFYNELLTTYLGMEMIARRGNLMIEITDNKNGMAVGVGAPIMPDLLQAIVQKAQKPDVRLIVDNSNQPESVS